jgi:hypothetical protein
LTTEQILGWADTHRRRTGRWPTHDSGPIPRTHGETWEGVDAALRFGCRSIVGGMSLARFLAAHRGARNIKALPRLTRKQILRWADEHHKRTGEWPYATSGPITGTSETWKRIDPCLLVGGRGLRGGSSVARLLAKCRGKRNLQALAPLNIKTIVGWAKLHHRRTGKWPSSKSGVIEEAGDNTHWKGVDSALRTGGRGLRGGTTLAKVMRRYRKGNQRRNQPSPDG